MLLWNLDILRRDPQLFLLIVGSLTIAVLLAITIHEFGHAAAASALGDPTPKRFGRLSINPLRHLDVMGTLMIFLVGFGWGKPVPIGLGHEARKKVALVAVAGPLSNIFLAAVLGIFVRVGLVEWHSPLDAYAGGWEAGSIAAFVVGWLVFINILLAVFNLMPVPPLDGFNIAMGIVPERHSYGLAKIERYGPLLLLAVVILGYYTGFLWDMLLGAADPLATVLVGKGI